MNKNLTGKIDITATLACIGALVFWAVGANFIKYITGYLDLWTQNMLRYIAACLFWLPFLVMSCARNKCRWPLWRITLLPALINIIMQSLCTAAFYYLEPAFIDLAGKSSTLMIICLSLIFFVEERVLLKSRRFWFGAVLSIIGILGVMLNEETLGSPRTLTGMIIILCYALTFALYTICVKTVFRNTDSRIGFSLMSIYTVIGLSALAFLFGHPADCLKIPPFLWFCVIVSGVTSIGLSHVLYYVAIKRIGATIPALTLFATPLLVFAISSITFHERLSLTQCLFGLILLSGSALAIYSQQHLKTE